MEEVRAYIESGILELYVLGELGAEERLEVEQMAAKHPEVRAELSDIERSMELFADEHAIEPSEQLRDRVLNSLLTNLADDNTFKQETTREKAAAKVVAMTPPPATNFYKYAFAASLALLLISIAALVNIYNKLQVSNNQIAALSTQNQQFSKTVSYQNNQLAMLRDTAYKIIKLQGTPKSASSALMVAWSPAKKKVMIDMAGMKMPSNDAQHQYQLWAIVAGKPVDLGVFDATKDSSNIVKVMKSVAAPQAFAVTLEPRGGSPGPHLENLMAIANI